MSWFNRKSLKRIRTLIETIRAGEFNLHFNSCELRGQERRLVEELNSVVDDIRHKLERQEELYGSYQAMLNQVDVSLLAVNSSGKVLWMNQKAIDDLCGYAIDSLSSLETAFPAVVAQMNKLQPGQQRLISLTKNGQHTQLKVAMVRYIQGGEAIRLFTLENIQQVIQHTQTQAQNKLISVLTHEIMNSLSPIISLSETMLENMRDQQKLSASTAVKELDDEKNLEGAQTLDSNTGDFNSNPDLDLEAQENLMAMEIVNRRSRGLLKFVENYRKLSRISAPELAWTPVGQLMDGIKRLVTNENCDIKFEIEDPELKLNIDSSQMEQVLLNLLKNAIEAFDSAEELSVNSTDNPNQSDNTSKNPKSSEEDLKNNRITVRAHADHATRQYLISVSDNGQGITHEALENIFVPFYTTKKNGSGIGLSLSRQIIMNHGGIITVQSKPGNTTFTVTLPLVYQL